MTSQFNAENFSQEVLNSSQPVLVDFWAPWCPPCRALNPTITELAEDHSGEAIVGKVNVDENQELAANFGVSSIPAVIVFKDGEVVERIIGVNSKEKYAEAIGRHVN